MGLFVNPDNSAFQVALNSEIYIDKTGLLKYTNKVMDTRQALICNSRPRRFGKTTTADMLTAYYSRGCHSETMFDGKEISKWDSFKTHLNRYDLIRLDVQWFLSPSRSADTVVSHMEQCVLKELKEYYPEVSEPSLSETLAAVKQTTGNKFIIIIDEWDALIRDEAENLTVQEEYIGFLRSLFKGSHPAEYLHLAYLTGILPVKKLKTQSALNNFEEFTMLSSGVLTPYIGFTEEEVKNLCSTYNRPFSEVKRWYDGYMLEWMPPAASGSQDGPSLERCHIYNPMAVDKVMRYGIFESYWSQTGTYDSIVPLINQDFDGLQEAVLRMISGTPVEVDIRTFQNDMVSFAGKDDVLTVLVHLGYLSYDRTMHTVSIPNEEIRSEFINATKKNKWNDLLELQKKCLRFW